MKDGGDVREGECEEKNPTLTLQKTQRWDGAPGVPCYGAGDGYERGQKHLNAEVAENSRGGRREGHVAAFACCARADSDREERQLNCAKTECGEKISPNVARAKFRMGHSESSCYARIADPLDTGAQRRALLRSRR